MHLVALHVRGMCRSQSQGDTYALILDEVGRSRKLPIVVGPLEAQAIAIALEDSKKQSKPLPHDVLKDLCSRFEIIVKRVVIHKLVDGIFYSTLICQSGEKEAIIDIRTSDAIAVALRFKVPVLAHRDVLDAGGIYVKAFSESDNHDDVFPGGFVLKTLNIISKQPPEQKESKCFKEHSLKTLQKLLQRAISDEDYEAAAHIRDEISKRTQ